MTRNNVPLLKVRLFLSCLLWIPPLINGNTSKYKCLLLPSSSLILPSTAPWSTSSPHLLQENGIKYWRASFLLSYACRPPRKINVCPQTSKSIVEHFLRIPYKLCHAECITQQLARFTELILKPNQGLSFSNSLGPFLKFFFFFLQDCHSTIYVISFNLEDPSCTFS